MSNLSFIPSHLDKTLETLETLITNFYCYENNKIGKFIKFFITPFLLTYEGTKILVKRLLFPNIKNKKQNKN